VRVANDEKKSTRALPKLHFDPQATTFLSPPGGIYLIFQGGQICKMFPPLMKLKMADG